MAPPAADPDRLYAQNHGGVCRSDDAGLRGTSIADGLPADFGFPIVSAHDPRRRLGHAAGADVQRGPPDGHPLLAGRIRE